MLKIYALVGDEGIVGNLIVVHNKEQAEIICSNAFLKGQAVPLDTTSNVDLGDVYLNGEFFRRTEGSDELVQVISEPTVQQKTDMLQAANEQNKSRIKYLEDLLSKNGIEVP